MKATRSRIAQTLFSATLTLTLGHAGAQAAASGQKHFEIGSTSLSSALREFARQSDQQILFSTEVVNDKQTSGFKGDLQPEAALKILLQGTGLTFGVTPDATILVKSPKAGNGANVPVSEKALMVAQAGTTGNADNQPLPSKKDSTAISSETDAGQNTRLDEIVVTAQKRTENIQNVPISAQVVTGETIAAQNLTSLENLSQSLPAVHISADAGASDMYIRGIGSAQFESLDQSVATFIDDIYHGRSRTTAATFLDLDRVEILKGPQSTFFGDNAIAGAINMQTNKPGATMDASARALYGMFGQYAVEGAVGGPLTDTIGVRLAGTDNGFATGWIDNENLDRHVPTSNNVAGRITLRFRPNVDFDATLKIEGSDEVVRNGGWGLYPFQIVNCPERSPIPNDAAGAACPFALSNKLPVGIDNNANAASPGNRIDLSSSEEVLTINYQHWGQTFTAVTGFTKYNFNNDLDANTIPQYLITTELPENYRQFSQEVRVTSPADQPITYLAGIYFQTDRSNIGYDVGLPFLDSVVQSVPPFAPLVPYLPLARSIPFTQGEHVYSVFGSVDWKATDRLKFTAGLRGSWDNKSYRQSIVWGTNTTTFGGFVPLPPALESIPNAFGAGAAGSLSDDRADHAWLPSARAQYQLNPQAMTYFSYSRGFLAGGFNSAESSGDPTRVAYKPEFANAYELGFKSTWLDNRLRLNIDVFRSEFSDLQVESFSQNAQGIGADSVNNAAASVSQGIEFEGQWAINQAFRVGANVTYLNAYYVSYPKAPDTLAQTVAGIPFQNLSGRPTLFAPPWSGSVVADYTVTLPNGYKLISELSPYFSSSYYVTGDGGDDHFNMQSYSFIRLDARLSLESPDHHWIVDLIGKNLTDQSTILAYGTQNAAAKEMPRNVAIQFRYRL